MAVYENSAPMEPILRNFVGAAGINNKTQISAVRYLITNFQSSGLYDKMLAIWPMVGGTSGSHKFNLKNPVDSDAAYRLSFQGGWTHSSSGSIPDGTTGYANTYVQPSNTFFVVNNFSGSFSGWYYSNSNPGPEFPNLYGAVWTPTYGGNNSGIGIQTGNDYHYINNTEGGRTNFTLPKQKGLLGASRTGSASFKIYTTGSVASTQVVTSTTPISFNLYLAAANNSGVFARDFTNQICSFAAFGIGLNDTEVSVLNTIVHQYQTLLGRNAY
jgi:hypothetical protein